MIIDCLFSSLSVLCTHNYVKSKRRGTGPVAEHKTVQWGLSSFFLCQYVKERFSERRAELAQAIPSAELFEAKPQRTRAAINGDR